MKIVCAVFTAMMVFCLCSPAFPEIYYWKDKNGVVHFTNRTPAEGQAEGTMKEITEPPSKDRTQVEKNTEAAAQYSREAADRAAAQKAAAAEAAQKALEQKKKALEAQERDLEREMVNKRRYFKKEDGRRRLNELDRINQQLDDVVAKGGGQAEVARLKARKRELIQTMFVDRRYFRGGGEALLIKWQAIDARLQQLEASIAAGGQ
jgi:Domain of unknown function (DUF4124)